MTIADFIRSNPYSPAKWKYKTHWHRWLVEEYEKQHGYKTTERYVKKVGDQIPKEIFQEVARRYNKDGELTSSVHKLKPIPHESAEGMMLKRISKSNTGVEWARYEAPEINLNEAIEQIRKALIEEIKPYTPPPVNGGGCILNIYTSDKHFGAHTKENSVYQNEYNPKVFDERHDHLLDAIEKERSRFGNFDQLNYFDLGDAADGWGGETTRKGHKLPQNLDNAGQWKEYVKSHRRAWDSIMQMNPAASYRFIGAPNSNHGGDFDYILMQTVLMYLELKYPSVERSITDKPFDHIQVGNHSIIYGHGKDDEDMKSGFPLNLNDRTENWLNDYIDQKELKGIIHFVAGDLHQSAMNYGKRFRYRRVLSMYGSSKWIHTNFGSGRPGVSYDIVDGDEVYTKDLLF